MRSLLFCWLAQNAKTKIIITTAARKKILNLKKTNSAKPAAKVPRTKKAKRISRKPFQGHCFNFGYDNRLFSPFRKGSTGGAGEGFNTAALAAH